MLPAIIAAGAALGASALSNMGQKEAIRSQERMNEENLNYQKNLNAQERTDKLNAINNAGNAIDKWNIDAQAILGNYENNRMNFSNPGDLQKYQDLKGSYNPADYVYDFDKFDDSKYKVENYLNPNKDRILSDVAKAAQSTAASTGMGRSSGAAQAINQSIADKSEALYNNAVNQMNQDKAFDYGAYTNYINQMQNKLNTMQNGVMNQMNMMKGDLQIDQNNLDQDVQNRLSLGNSIANSKAQLLM